MTYREIKAALDEMTDEMLDVTATVFDTERLELYAVTETTLMSFGNKPPRLSAVPMKV